MMKTEESTALVPRQTGALAIIGTQLRLKKKILDTHRLATTFDEFHVPRDGSLYDAVERVKPGGTIRIAAGEYRIDRVIHINKPLSIIGEGKEQSVLVSSLGEHYLKVKHDGYFAISHITFKSQDLFAGMVYVACGEIQIEHNDFVGGYKVKCNKGRKNAIPPQEPKAPQHYDDIGGALIVKGGTKGNISNNVFSQNHDGLRLEGESKLTAIGNIARNNRNNGIQILDSAAANIHRNTCENNGCDGIFFGGESVGIAEGNVCRKNKRIGITICGNASPTLLQNTCESNDHHGIHYQNDATGTAEGNVCRKNKDVGITIFGNASPTLLQNTCESNDQQGIYYQGNANGTAEGNVCRVNGQGGIAVLQSANPNLINNIEE